MNITDLERLMQQAVRPASFDTLAIPTSVYVDLARQPDYSAVAIVDRMRGAAPTLFGMRVIVNDMIDKIPAKVHRRRRGMSEAYHRRIQKKWNKLYGTGPGALMINSAAMREYLTKGRIMTKGMCLVEGWER